MKNKTKLSFQPLSWKKLQIIQIFPSAVGMASNFGHRSRRSKTFGYGRRTSAFGPTLLVAILKISFTICHLLIVRTEKQIHTSKELKPMFEPSFLAKVGQHSIMPSFEELIRVVYWGQFLVLTPTCCSHLLNPRFLWHNGVKYYLKLQYDFYSYTVRRPL